MAGTVAVRRSARHASASIAACTTRAAAAASSRSTSSSGAWLTPGRVAHQHHARRPALRDHAGVVAGEAHDLGRPQTRSVGRRPQGRAHRLVELGAAVDARPREIHLDARGRLQLRAAARTPSHQRVELLGPRRAGVQPQPHVRGHRRGRVGLHRDATGGGHHLGPGQLVGADDQPRRGQQRVTALAPVGGAGVVGRAVQLDLHPHPRRQPAHHAGRDRVPGDVAALVDVQLEQPAQAVEPPRRVLQPARGPRPPSPSPRAWSRRSRPRGPGHQRRRGARPARGSRRSGCCSGRPPRRRRRSPRVGTAVRSAIGEARRHAQRAVVAAALANAVQVRAHRPPRRRRLRARPQVARGVALGQQAAGLRRPGEPAPRASSSARPGEPGGAAARSARSAPGRQQVGELRGRDYHAVPTAARRRRGAPPPEARPRSRPPPGCGRSGRARAPPARRATGSRARLPGSSEPRSPRAPHHPRRVEGRRPAAPRGRSSRSGARPAR